MTLTGHYLALAAHKRLNNYTISVMNAIKVIAFDADDTLWINEPHFRHTEQQFAELLEDFLPSHTLSRELLTVEIQNLPTYGYGVKGFTLSMIETALRVSDGAIGVSVVDKIIRYGKELLDMPIELINGVEEVLQALQGRYRLVMATKGDLLEQANKLKKSGLERYFHHIEIVSEKQESEYRKLIKHLDSTPEEFLMVGNSLKSDIIPVLAIGGHGFHVPFHMTWAHETVDYQVEHANFKQLTSIREVLSYLP